MNCRTASRLLSAERDRVLSPEERTGFESHLAGCAKCQQARAVMAASLIHWQATAKEAELPEVEHAWQDIRRATRSTAPAQSANALGALRWAVPLGAAAALAIVAAVAPRSGSSRVEAAQVAQREVAHADFVEVPANASSMVYVDDQSGWLVVWSESDATPSGG